MTNMQQTRFARIYAGFQECLFVCHVCAQIFSANMTNMTNMVRSVPKSGGSTRFFVFVKSDKHLTNTTNIGKET
jgi:hypothetical protein